VGAPLEREVDIAMKGQDEAERLAKDVRIVALATRALGETEGFAWLQRSNAALGGCTPLELSGTEAGMRRVEQIIGRIEYGVYS
jgi:putative toxin-antitoxin system antitoxin component (TIGR02293 family)